MTRNPVTKIGLNAQPKETDSVGWTKVEGNPTMKTWVEYTTDGGSTVVGWWEATPGTYRQSSEAWEFVHLIDGRIILTPDGADPVEVGPGDAFVVEKGFKGTWKIVEKVRKHFVIRRNQ
ncbi:MAG TPA: hypothetical protein DCW88_09660 [Agrobacterium sp.]|uniref:cupin domain-containing protein n=1 Tax=Agrobacterium pusense TaxID=648995 RepID=UPI000E980233|nr:hypothetical protein [Agrobacterium sp.]